MRRMAAVWSVVLLLALAAPAASSAMTHYASPSPQGFADCTTPQNACTLPVALTGSPTEVVLATGTYGSSGSPVLTSYTLPIGADVHGPATGELPHIFVGGTIGITAGVNSKLRRVHVTGTGAYAAAVSSGILDQVLADGLLNTNACEGAPGTISNSVCLSNSNNLITGAYNGSLSSSGALTVTLRNDTLIGTGTAHGVETSVGGSNPITFNFVNTIARGPGGAVQDIRAYSSVAGTTLNFSYSNYGTVMSTGTAVTTPPGSGTNQTAAPLLNSSFRELPGSPTIDAGITEAANGPFDLDGNPRSQGRTDIGAFETALPPSPAAPASPLSFSLAARKVKVNRKGKGRLPFTCRAAGGGSCLVSASLLSKTKAARSAKKKHKSKRKKVGTVSGSVPAGQTGALLVRLNGRGKKLIRAKRKRKLKAKLTGSVFDGVGQTASLVSTLKLKLKGKKHT